MKFSLLFGLFGLFVLAGCSSVKKIEIAGVREVNGIFIPAWTKNLDPEYNSGNLPIAYNAPLIHESILYLNTPEGSFVAYDLKNGRELWNKFDGSSANAAPIIFKEFVIYGNSDGSVVSRNYLSGEEKYIVDVGASVEAEPFVYNSRMFLHLRDHKIVAMDVETGKVLWVYKRSIPFLTTLQRVSGPLAYNNKLFVGSADGYLLAFSIEDGTLIWEQKIVEGNKFIDIDNAPVVFEDKLIVSSASGETVVLDPNTGAIIRKLPFISTRKPVVAKSALVFGTDRGEIVVVDQGFNIIDKKKVCDDAISAIAMWKNGYVVADLKGNLNFVDGISFKVLESSNLGHSYSTVFGKLAVGDEALAVLSSRNRLYVFK